MVKLLFINVMFKETFQFIVSEAEKNTLQAAEFVFNWCWTLKKFIFMVIII